MHKGEYSVKMKSGGTLHVSAFDIRISFYFAGPDRRYNGTFINISLSEFDKYIAAFKSNFDKYKELKQVIKGASFSIIGDCDMPIYVGSKFIEGVFLTNGIYHHHLFPISNEQKLNQIISEFEYAKTRGLEIQSLLFGK